MATNPQLEVRELKNGEGTVLTLTEVTLEDAGNYTVTVKNKFGEKSNHVRLSMKDQNQPAK